MFYYAIISDSREITRARKSLLVQNFKCHHEYSDSWDSLGNEEPIYACKFGEGQEYGHILVVADEMGAVGLRDTRTTASTDPVKSMYILMRLHLSFIRFY